MKRVMLASFTHETNMFNPFPTGLDDYKLRGLLFGDEVYAKRRNTNSEVGGSIAVFEKNGIEMVPSVFAHAMPAGVVTEEAVDVVVGSMLDTLDRHAVDGVVLHLHGAMVTEKHDDGEGYVISEIRKKVGDDIPIAVTLDLHATLTPLMIETADFITIYRTYPHMDFAERGREAASVMIRMMNREIRPVMALSKPPVIIGPPMNVLPVDMPMKAIMDRARAIESENTTVLAACPAHGFIQQDVPYGGIGVVVTADRDKDLALRYADELGNMMFECRKDYCVDLPNPEETIRLASKSSDYPVAIADSGDNIGGGTPGDGTALLHEILKQGVDSAFVPLWDPTAARAAADAGVGSVVTLDVGGKSDPLYGPPVRITGRVRTITDGVYLNREGCGYSAGVMDSMGLSARIDVDGVTIVLNSIATSPNNVMHAKAIGVYPEDYRMSVCKGGLAFREAYKPPLVRRYIQSDTPGYSSSNFSNFTFKKLRRPIFPIDDI